MMLKVTSDPLSLEEAFAQVRRPDCGAIALFVGTVRNLHEGRKVVSLSYTAFREMAEKEFARIARECRERYGTGEVHIAHRTGMVHVGEASVILAVSAAGRAEAFEGCRYVIESLKKMAPIWKEEFHEEGRSWVAG